MLVPQLRHSHPLSTPEGEEPPGRSARLDANAICEVHLLQRFIDPDPRRHRVAAVRAAARGGSERCRRLFLRPCGRRCWRRRISSTSSDGISIAGPGWSELPDRRMTACLRSWVRSCARWFSAVPPTHQHPRLGLCLVLRLREGGILRRNSPPTRMVACAFIWTPRFRLARPNTRRSSVSTVHWRSPAGSI